MKKILFILSLFIPLAIYGQNKNIDPSLLAVEGYDLVSYFTEKGPQKGLEKHQFSWEGARYLFSSAKNKNAFKAHPEKYLPAYGGWCAYAMTRGKEVEINPKAYYIQQEQLYLFFKTNWVDTQAKWIKNHANYKAKADDMWAKKNATEN